MLIRAKEKISRRYKQNLFLKGERSLSQKSAMVRRPYPPGSSPNKKRRISVSDYSLHLIEKQMVRFSYGIKEAQLRRYFKLANRSKGNTAFELLKLLETRLDNVVFRSGFVISRSIAKQLVSHGHLFVNGRKVTLTGLSVRKGDKISINPKAAGMDVFRELAIRLKNYQAPSWLDVNKQDLTATIARMPVAEDVQTPFNFQLLVEFYSR